MPLGEGGEREAEREGGRVSEREGGRARSRLHEMKLTNADNDDMPHGTKY